MIAAPTVHLRGDISDRADFTLEFPKIHKDASLAEVSSSPPLSTHSIAISNGVSVLRGSVWIEAHTCKNKEPDRAVRMSGVEAHQGMDAHLSPPAAQLEFGALLQEH
jgi:hypothetical protein